MTADSFRRLALAMPGATEGAHMGHPDFRVNGRIFATLHAGDRSGMVKLAPPEQQALVQLRPAAFSPSSGAWGRQGCTTVTLAAADEATVRGAITLAWERAMAYKQSVSKRPGAGRRPAPGGKRGRRR